MIKKIFKIILSGNLKLAIINEWNNFKNNARKKRIINYYKNQSQQDSGITEAIDFLKKNPLSYYPYEWSKNYNSKEVEVFCDEETKLFYTIFDGKKLFFNQNLDEWKIKRMHNFSQIEQDILSPHRYLTDDFEVTADDVVLDIGAAEANFSLNVVEKVKKIYIFEPEDIWLEALNKTFEPWKHKVEVIQSFVSDKTEGQFISINDFFADKKEKPTLIKLDVEGFEKQVLDGASDFIDKADMRCLICTYHRENDLVDLSNYMSQRGYSVTPSDRYVLIGSEAPYFRKGLIRCKKKQ
jgi:hypothetical protein